MSHTEEFWKDEINYVHLDDISFKVEPTVEFYRHKSNGMLSLNINLEAEPDDEDAEPFTLSIQGMPTDLTNIKELEGRSFTYEESSSLAGFIDCDDEKYPNEKDTIEFLKISDNKILIKWTFSCSVDCEDPFEYDVPIEIIIKADYEITDTTQKYPVVYNTSEYEVAEGEINYMMVDGIYFEIDPENDDVVFYPNKDDLMLIMNLYIHPRTFHNHIVLDIDDEDEGSYICMSAEGVRVGVSDVKELKGKVFHNDELDGSVYCVEHESNTEETLEILEVTDQTLLIHWSGLCSIGYGGLGYDLPFDSIFEIKYEIK